MRGAAPEIVEQIYEAAFQPDVWRQALAGLAASVSARGAGLIVVDEAGRPSILGSTRYEQLADVFFARLGHWDNPRPVRHLRRGHHGFLADLDLCTPEELAVDPIYEVVLRPNGISHSAGSTIALPHGDMLLFDVLRDTRAGAFDAAALATLDAHRPHLARAALVSARLGLERARAAAQALEALGLPGAVVSSTGKVLAANAPFEKLAPCVATGAGDRLRIADPGARAAFARALAGAPGPGRSIPIPGDDSASATILHVLPLKRSALEIFSGATAFVVATSLAGAVETPQAALSSLFDLSPAEAKVAGAFAESASVETLSSKLELAPSTVRGHLKAVFAKTGVHSQAQLVALLMRASLPAQRRSGP